MYYLAVGILWSVVLVIINIKSGVVKSGASLPLSIFMTVFFWWLSMYLLVSNKISKTKSTGRDLKRCHEFDYKM